MTRPRQVRIVEVGARDGLQNEPKAIPAATKIAFIEMLGEAGLSHIEAGAFVSPKAVPQMADTMDVMTGLKRREGVVYPVLALNLKGLDAAIKAQAEEVAVFAAASEAFTKANANCTIEESLERVAEICDLANENNIRVRGYISCVMGCPYEGHVDPGLVADLAEKLMAMGCYGISLGDTVGYGTPDQARDLINVVAKAVPHDKLAVHFHDTYGQALSNILAVLDQGITVIDTAVAGLGGCPYAPGAAGNVATEDVLYMLNGLGVETGVDLDKVAEAGRFICAELGRQPVSKVALALAAKTTN